MSDLTDFFPATGGGSLVSYDPLTLNRVNVSPTLLKAKSTNGSYNDSTNTVAFWNPITNTTYGQTGAAIDMALGSTAFQQVVSVSNVGKGGKLVCVIGPGVNVNAVVTFKITIDGTATEIEYTNVYGAEMRACLGGILAGQPQNGSSNAGLISSPFDGGYYHARSNTYGTNSNGFASTGANVNSWSLPTVFDGINQIQFKDTCVVEIKGNPNTGFNRMKAGVIIVPN